MNSFAFFTASGGKESTGELRRNGQIPSAFFCLTCLSRYHCRSQEIKHMGRWGKSAILGGLIIPAILIAGCAPKQPTAQNPISPESRPSHPPLWDLNDAASNAAKSLLADPAFNTDKRGWTLAVDRMDDDTAGSTFQHDYDLFLDHLRTALFQQSNGRVQLIEKRATPNNIPGPISPTPPPRPDFLLSGKAMDKRGNILNAYELDLTVTGAGTRLKVWTATFDVCTPR
jgi:hypothetical protein